MIPRYLKALQSPDFDHGDIFCAKVYKVLGDWNLLFDEKTYRSKSNFQKLINLLLMACPFVHWLSVFFYLLLNFDSTSLVIMGEDIAFSIGGLLVGYRLVNFNYRRAEVSKVVYDLNELSKEMREEEEGRQLSNFIHYWQIIVSTLVTVMGGSIGFPQFVFAIYSGVPYYNIYPADLTKRSAAFWAICTFQGFTLASSTISSCLQECIVSDWFIQASILFSVANRRISRLREEGDGGKINEEAEFKKLLKIIKEVQKIERILEPANRFVNVHLGLIFTFFYMAVAMSAFVIMSVADQGVIYIMKSLLYPLFTLGVIIMWCNTGQVIIDESNRFSASLFQSNWLDAPMKYRKLMLMFMLRCSHTIEVDARPFYSIKQSTFQDFIRRVYYAFAILLDMKKKFKTGL